MSGSDRSRLVPAGRSIEHDAAVSEIIGAVLLIALVVAGGTMVGVALFSQPMPNQVPKVNIVIGADENGTVTLIHNGGEALNASQYRVYLNQTLWPEEKRFLNNITPAETTAWTVGNSLALRGSDANLTESVTVEYYGSSGNVTITSVRSVRNDGTEGAGFGFFSALYEHLFGAETPEGIRPLPVRQVTQYEPVKAYAWPANMSPQVNFTLDPTARIFLYASDTKQAEIDFIKSTYPGVPVEPCTDPATNSNTINDALVNPSHGWVTLLNGTYDCTGPIVCSPDYRILEAYESDIVDMPMKTLGDNEGYIKVSGSNVIIRGLNLYGTGGVKIVASDPGRWTTNVSIRNVNVTSRDLNDPDKGTSVPPKFRAPINGMFFVWADKNSLNNIEFYNCTASECNTHGWNMNQNYDDGVERTISNTRFVNCGASFCGYGVSGDRTESGEPFDSTHKSRSEWITGFDLHEWQDLVGCHVYNCTADNNWESGFHFEPGARYDDNGGDIGPRTLSEDVTLDNCTSVNNGIRNTYEGKFFLSGYYLSRNTTLTNCTSAGNANAGFYVHGGTNSQFINCNDTGSKNSGFFVIKGSSDITIDNCTSASNPRFALWAAFTENLQVKNFRQINVAGDRGTQSILGWYKDDSRYGLPVEGSSFQITSSGSSLPIINKAGSGNTYDLTPP